MAASFTVSGTVTCTEDVEANYKRAPNATSAKARTVINPPGGSFSHTVDASDPDNYDSNGKFTGCVLVSDKSKD